MQYESSLEFRPVLSHEFGILDGISGTGKSMLSPFISALPNVTRVAIDETLEQLLVMRHRGLIQEDVSDICGHSEWTFIPSIARLVEKLT